ncbi:hypothetical protein ACFFK0_22945 [Paenibacillus chartarius]|uniref:EamA domain-containing protein n=1 Tax=Paenibacillus chartarius TaxID=747481 RepID=A0ABV6DRI0_9BACL
MGMLQTAGPLLYLSGICNGVAVALIYPTLLTYLTFVLPEKSRHLLLGFAALVIVIWYKSRKSETV